MTVMCWNLDEEGRRCILSGNEASARGAIEAGVRVVSSYPGSPSVQILECLAAAADQRNIYAEWSVNEKVALEVAAAASFAGLRALCVMKADGLNVAMDFLTTLPMSGIRGGLVLIVSDDPGAHSSVKEEDTRFLAPPAHVPLLEPSSPEEARDMVIWAFALSEAVGLPVMVRLVTRICHARGTLTLGAIYRNEHVPALLPGDRFITAARFHAASHEKIESARGRFSESPFNSYSGPDRPDLIVFASGVGYFYALEAAERLGVENRVGIAKVGTPWPLPLEPVLKCLERTKTFLFLEEIEPFLEEQVMLVAAENWREAGERRFLGKKSGDVPWLMKGRGMGEIDPDIAARAISGALGNPFESPSDSTALKEEAEAFSLPMRYPSLCAGCPHRASFWAINKALELDGRQGFVLGDIGCYALGVLPTGYETLRTVHSMGSGLGLASGLGKLNTLGFAQPIIAVIGDSTFYHAGIPPLMNAKSRGADFLCIILDNETTAMTGHQPHPGIGRTAGGAEAYPVSMEGLIRALDIPLAVHDPYQVDETVETILRLLEKKGLKVLVLRRECALQALRAESKSIRVRVDETMCLGDECGCNRFCSRVFSCPANIWDENSEKARIDDVLCMGCGVCASLCPEGAIVVESDKE